MHLYRSLSFLRASYSAGCFSAICAYVMPSQIPASISSRAFQRSFANGSAAAVCMVRCSVEVHTLTGTGVPSADCVVEGVWRVSNVGGEKCAEKERRAECRQQQQQGC
jgi:uncharacterized lipoprotein YmbA